MHHEILLTLLGYESEFVKESKDGCEIEPKISFLSCAEKDQLNRIVSLGFYYKRLKVLMGKIEDSNSKSEVLRHERRGLYVQALGRGVEELLERYRSCIQHIEKEILRGGPNAVVPYSRIVFLLHEYHDLLPDVYKLLDFALEQNVRGAQLLETVYRKFHESGFPLLRDQYGRCLYYMHQVLFNQIHAWMSDGEVIDPFDEFFVRCQSSRAIASVGWEERHWSEEYAISLENVPAEYFPVSLAEKIFFIGKCTHMISSSKLAQNCDTSFITHNFGQIKHMKEFHLLTMEYAIERIRLHVAGKLQIVLVEENHLLHHLKALKQYFFMSKGEFFRFFIEFCTPVMKKPPTYRSELDLRTGPFRKAALAAHVDEDPYFQNLSVKMITESFDMSCMDILTHLTLCGALEHDQEKKIVSPSATNNAANKGTNCGALWYNLSRDLQKNFCTEFSYSLNGIEASGSAIAGLDPMDGPSIHFVLQDSSSGVKVVPYKRSEVLPALPGPNAPCSPSKRTKLHHKRVNLYHSISGDIPCSSPCREIERYFCLDVYESKIDLRWKGPKKEEILQSGSIESSSSITNTVRIEFFRSSTSSKSNRKVSISVFLNEKEVLKWSTKEDSQDRSSVGQLLCSSEAIAGIVMSQDCHLKAWKWIHGGAADKPKESTTFEKWAALDLQYNLTTALRIVLTKECMDIYSKMFGFLFSIKRTEFHLHQVWKTFNKRTGNRIETSRLSSFIFDIRHQMNFFLNHLQFYLQADVIERHFQDMMKEFDDGGESAQSFSRTADTGTSPVNGGSSQTTSRVYDFERVCAVHLNYLSSIQKNSYLESKTVQSAISSVLKTCWEFCSVMESLDDAEYLKEDRLVQMKHLKSQFEKHSTYVFTILYKTNGARSFISHLDYNGYFSTKAAELVGSTVLTSQE